MKRIRTISMIMAISMMAMVASCSSKTTVESIKVRSGNDGVTEATLEITTETVEETTVETTTESTTEETTEETTTEETTEATTAAPEDNSAGSIRYRAYMEYCSQLDSEGDYYFAFKEDYDYKPLSFDLEVYDETNKVYTCYYYTDEGEMTEKESYEYKSEASKYGVKFDAFSKLPCMTRTGVFKTDIMVDEIPDGRYFGSIAAISMDGTKMYIWAGEPITLTEDDFLNLQAGDVIDVYGGLTVASVNESYTDGRRVSFEDNDSGLWFTNDEYLGNGGGYILENSNDNPATTNTKIVEVPISPNCEFDDHFTLFVDQGDVDTYILDNNLTVPLTKTAFWYYTATYEYAQESSNGWIPAYGCLYPIIIENGEVVQVSLQWR